MATVITTFDILSSILRSYTVVLFLVFVFLIGLSVWRPKQFGLPIFYFGLVVLAFGVIHFVFVITFPSPGFGPGLHGVFIIVSGIHLIAGSVGLAVRWKTNLLDTKNLSIGVIVYSFLFSFISISIIFTCLYLTNNNEPYPPSCASNLDEMHTRLQFYQQKNNTHISYEEIEGSEYDNWGRFIIANQIKDPETKRRIMSHYLTCPAANRLEQTVNDYWWADLSNEGCFPNNKLGPSVKPKTPIAGDHPDNHMDSPPLVLLKNGNVKLANRGSKLWTRAYGGGEGNCLKPPGDN